LIVVVAIQLEVVNEVGPCRGKREQEGGADEADRQGRLEQMATHCSVLLAFGGAKKGRGFGATIDGWRSVRRKLFEYDRGPCRRQAFLLPAAADATDVNPTRKRGIHFSSLARRVNIFIDKATLASETGINQQAKVRFTAQRFHKSDFERFGFVK